MQKPVKIKQIIHSYNIKPKKRLGQNFLLCLPIINKVIAAAELKPFDIVLEVGPGLGSLTLSLAEQVKKVVAVEKDRQLAKALEEILKSQNINNVEIVSADILEYQMSKDYKLVANLPYNIAATVVMKFLEAKKPPELMVVMLQKEVAQRMRSTVPRMTKLGVFTQFYSEPKIISTVSKNCYFPKPKVDSAILLLKPKLVSKNIDQKLFSKVVRAGFSHPRKQLINNLSKPLNLTRAQTEQWLLKNKIRPQQRAETLTIENWLNLSKTISF